MLYYLWYLVFGIWFNQANFNLHGCIYIYKYIYIYIVSLLEFENEKAEEDVLSALSLALMHSKLNLRKNFGSHVFVL